MGHCHSAQLGSSDVFCVFFKPTGLNITVSFMLDSCHSLAHFSYGGVLVVTPYSFSIITSLDRFIFV